MSRRDARCAAFKMIYEYSLSKYDTDKATVNEVLDNLLDAETEEALSVDDEREYVFDVVSGVVREYENLKELAGKFSKNWSIERVSAIDRAILYVAIFEILHRDDIPLSVSINEAVEIAKKYGAEDSSAYVNGVLGGFAKSLKNEKK